MGEMLTYRDYDGVTPSLIPRLIFPSFIKILKGIEVQEKLVRSLKQSRGKVSKKKKKGPDRIRTGDLLFTRQAL